MKKILYLLPLIFLGVTSCDTQKKLFTPPHKSEIKLIEYSNIHYWYYQIIEIEGERFIVFAGGGIQKLND